MVAQNNESRQLLLDVRNMVTTFTTPLGEIPVVNNISFQLYQGEALGIVGESGSGKTMTSLSLMGLLPSGIGRVAQGEAWFDGVDIFKLSKDQHRALRGSKMAMIFQDPMSSLSPFYTIEFQIAEMIKQHQKDLSRADVHQKVVNLLKEVGIPDPEQRARQYPHQFSGGMRQRIMIAMALANNPMLLIADEPTTALDVTIQAQVLALIAERRRERGMALLLISHDWGVVSALCDRIIVMYGGKILEQGSTEELWREPKHPYTQALLRSVPHWDTKKTDDLYVIPGSPPTFTKKIVGCPFAPRCEKAEARCREQDPPVKVLGKRREYCCIH